MEPLPVVSLNGEIREKETVSLPTSRSFFVGEGLFETIRVRNSHVELLPRHLARMAASAEALGLPLPGEREVETWVAAFLAKGRLMDGMIRLTLTREGAGGLDAPEGAEAVFLITGSHGSSYDSTVRAKGVGVCVVRDIVRPMDNSGRHKTTSYMPLIMARREAADRGARMALVLNQEGRLAEADCANVFVVMANGSVVTPPVEEGALPGIIRGVLLETVPEARERPVGMDLLLSAQAVFLTNSLMTVIPVQEEVSSGTRFEVGHPALSKFRKAVRRIVNGR